MKTENSHNSKKPNEASHGTISYFKGVYPRRMKKMRENAPELVMMSGELARHLIKYYRAYPKVYQAWLKNQRQ